MEFHLSTPMGYVESSPFFCAATKTVKDMVKNTMASIHDAHKNPLEKSTETLHVDGTGGAAQMIDQAGKN